ncbi:hypothetical protein A3G53_00620 [Candidatus Nomurabacteria bacterium RIFCSPLOWO2_12_FULL_44_11]|uniref:CYTH domain-containing protein n=1 Tax=Candidatus Nomurabacteria bacterium RIFCSPLOWO2_12_FULL_44_11 TaxID=1801796 RepID=A0A1F6Y4K1_9BACT|nr:MAG: hypothetical protein A3G53_00620 [Candidatus Nomurabacteria bacterium RIFCSPLOWO2_12_FULL_44_11]
MRLRSRNGSLELKIGRSSGASEEVEIKEKIGKYFKTNNLEKFIRDNLIIIIDYSIHSRRYKNGDFKIDIDEMNFGYTMTEIELLVEKEEEIQEAGRKIDNFAKQYNFEIKDINPKRKEYFRKVKPDVYNELYGKR